MSHLCDQFFIFIFIFIMINGNTGALVLLLIFQNMSYYFLMITLMKNVNNFQIAKDQPQGVASISARVAYESVAYKRKRVVALKN